MKKYVLNLVYLTDVLYLMVIITRSRPFYPPTFSLCLFYEVNHLFEISKPFIRSTGGDCYNSAAQRLENIAYREPEGCGIIPLLPITPSLLWPSVGGAVKVPFMDQIDLFKNYLYLLGELEIMELCAKKKIIIKSELLIETI